MTASPDVQVIQIRPHSRRPGRYFADVQLDGRRLCGLLVIFRAGGNASVIPPPAPRRAGGAFFMAYELRGAERAAIAAAVAEHLRYHDSGDAA